MVRAVQIESLSALTLFTGDMTRSVAFYKMLGFDLARGGPEAAFTTFRAGSQFLNLTSEGEGKFCEVWGRAIFYVSDVDAMYQRALALGFTPDFAPRNAAWNERYFHIKDPDGHEISFARPLGP